MPDSPPDAARRSGGPGATTGAVPLRPDDELRLGHLNLIAASAAQAGWSDEGALEDDGGLVLFASGSWIPVEFNGAYRTDDAFDADELVRRAERFFGDRRRGYSVKVRTTGDDEDLRRACERAGVDQFGEPAPQMICRARPVDEPAPDGIEVRVARTTADIDAFATLNGEAYATYGLPAAEMEAVFGRPRALLEAAEVVVVVAYDGDEPLAGALTYLSHGIAGLYFVGTVPRARNRGLGRAVALAATHAGFDRGGRVCILQASPMGEPIYLAMGYETLYHYDSYSRWASPPS